MKKGHKRLLLFELLMILILILNSFVWNILSRYILILFIIIILIIFKKRFGFEKDKHRYVKDIILETIIFLILYFIIYYLFGIIIGFARSGNYYTIEGLKNFLIPITCITISKEYLRYNMICKSEGSKICTAITIILFILLDITSAISFGSFTSKYDIFIFFSLTLLPAISTNIALTYITTKIGYKPLIIYSLIVGLYYYLLPIVPNPNEYVSSIIKFILPIIYCYQVYKFFHKERDEELERDYHKQKLSNLIIPTIIVIILVYFTSGYFHFWTIAVASGSMEPKIKKGDVVIIERLSNNYNKLKVGDVIAFKYKKIVVVHRLVNIVEDDGKYYFYTKGDANSKEDNFMIEENMIEGVVNHKIPLIGLPTVWLNEL